MRIDAEKKLHLYNRDFDEMRNLLDTSIQQIFGQMISRRIDAGAITLKIDFNVERRVVMDNNAPTGEREAINPEVTYKIGINMQQKASMDGDIIPKGSDELLIGDDKSYYLVSREEASGQLCMFNNWDEYAGAML